MLLAPASTYLAHAVYGYFLNGGGRCYVTRVVPAAAKPEEAKPAVAQLPSRASKALPSFTVASKGTPDVDIQIGLNLQRKDGGRWTGTPPATVEGVSTDTRTLAAGSLFVALRGERFDGHAFLADFNSWFEDRRSSHFQRRSRPALRREDEPVEQGQFGQKTSQQRHGQEEKRNGDTQVQQWLKQEVEGEIERLVGIEIDHRKEERANHQRRRCPKYSGGGRVYYGCPDPGIHADEFICSTKEARAAG